IQNDALRPDKSQTRSEKSEAEKKKRAKKNVIQDLVSQDLGEGHSSNRRCNIQPRRKLALRRSRHRCCLGHLEALLSACSGAVPASTLAPTLASKKFSSDGRIGLTQRICASSSTSFFRT